MNTFYIAVADVLMDIEKELRELQLWQTEMPSAEALSSMVPFAVDTLTFPQWLQFIFLPRMYGLLEHQQALPAPCDITTIAEEYFSVLNVHSTPLLLQIQRMDTLLNNQIK